MVSVTLPMAAAATPSSAMRCEALTACWTASLVMALARSALVDISLMVAVISSAAEATMAVLVDDCSMAAATALRLVVISSAPAATLLATIEVSRALSLIWPESVVRDSAESLTAREFPAIFLIISCRLPRNILNRRAQLTEFVLGVHRNPFG